MLLKIEPRTPKIIPLDSGSNFEHLRTVSLIRRVVESITCLCCSLFFGPLVFKLAPTGGTNTYCILENKVTAMGYMIVTLFARKY